MCHTLHKQHAHNKYSIDCLNWLKLSPNLSVSSKIAWTHAICVSYSKLSSHFLPVSVNFKTIAFLLLYFCRRVELTLLDFNRTWKAFGEWIWTHWRTKREEVAILCFHYGFMSYSINDHSFQFHIKTVFLHSLHTLIIFRSRQIQQVTIKKIIFKVLQHCHWPPTYPLLVSLIFKLLAKAISSLSMEAPLQL